MDRVKQLVKQRLAGVPVDAHPGADALSAFAENALPRAEMQRVVTHLAGCSDCRETLYLAQPRDPQTQPVAAYRPSKTYRAIRWATVFAPVVIVAGGLFLVRQEMSKSARHSGTTSEPQALNKVVAQQSAAESGAREKDERASFPNSAFADLRRSDQQSEGTLAKQRPEEKHMTAKLQAPLKFDSSDQVRPASRPADESSRDMPAPSAPADAGFAAGTVGANAAPAPAAPKPLAKEEGALTTGATPEIQASQEANVSTALLQTESAEVTDSKRRETTTETRSKQKTASVAQVKAGFAGKPNTSSAQWILSANGQVQRSTDAGKTWQPVPVGDKTAFRAIFAAGPEVWVGGRTGALYHSRDSGQSWERVVPATGGQELQSDITRIEFSGAQNGIVSTANNESWRTNDAGKTWEKK